MLEGAVLVISGSFNPPIFHPGWLLSVGLVTQSQAAAAAVNHSDSVLSRFQIKGMGVDVRPDQLTVASIDGTEPELVASFTVEMLRMLPHSVAHSVGMSRAAHVRLREGYTSLAERLSPLTAFADLLDEPQLDMLTVQGRAGSDEARVSVSIEPSDFAEHDVYIVVTKQLKRRQDDDHGAEWANAGIEQHWFPWMAEASALIASIVALADPAP